MNKIYTLVLILFIISCQKQEGLTVEISTAQKRTIVQKVKAVGKIEPETQVKISSEVSGELIFIGAQEGDLVAKNQVLAKVKPDIIEMQLEGSEAAANAAKMDIDFNKAQVTQAEQNFQRVKGLFEQEYASAQELEQAKAAYDQAYAQLQSSLARYSQAKASLKQLQRNADRTTIISPIEGILTALNVEIGEKILGTIQMQGTELMTVSDLDVINAIVDIDENDIVLIEMGDSVDVEIDAFPDSTFKGYVIEIGHSAISSNMGSQDEVTNFKVKVRLIDTNNKIRPGMSCNVSISTERRENVIAVPLQSVTVRNNEIYSKARGGMADKSKVNSKPKPIVFRYDGGKAIQNYVEIGISERGFIEITSGLDEGDSIISGPYSAVSKDLRDSLSVMTSKKGEGNWQGRRESGNGRGRN